MPLRPLRRLGPGCMRVVAPAAVPDSQLVADAGYMGAPTVFLERLGAGEAEAAIRAVLAAYRAAAPSRGSSPELAALMGFEVGGGNGLEAFSIAARLGVPAVDGDAMGRAFPELQVRGGAWAGWGSPRGTLQPSLRGADSSCPLLPSSDGHALHLRRAGCACSGGRREGQRRCGARRRRARLVGAHAAPPVRQPGRLSGIQLLPPHRCAG